MAKKTKKTKKQKRLHEYLTRRPVVMFVLLFGLLGMILTLLGSAQQQTKPLGVVLGPNFANMRDDDFYKTLGILQSNKIRWTRGALLWRQIETQDNVFNWSKVDRLYNETQKRGISVLINIQIGGSVPSWANGSSDTNLVPQDPAAYRAYVKQLVARMPNQLYYQIGNEPNTQDNWHPYPDPAHYAKYLQAAYVTIKQANPNAIVLSPGMGANHPPEKVPGNIQGHNFIRGLYQIGAQRYFDGVSFHPYSWQGMSTPDGLRELPGVIETMRQYGDANKPIWATEFGVPSTAVGLSGQASVLRDQYNNLAKFPQVKQMFWYELRDNDSSSTINRHNYGLVRTDFSTKPALGALAAITTKQSQTAPPSAKPQSTQNQQRQSSQTTNPTGNTNGPTQNSQQPNNVTSTAGDTKTVESASDALASIPSIITNPTAVPRVLSGPWGWLTGLGFAVVVVSVSFGGWKLYGYLQHRQKLKQFMTGIHK